ncbi:MAG: antitoxin [Candidatus Lambdaproteobacteria bacterium RIFOXYD2_FULL_50_16]|uniref:Antitoxin n=1 Tax=Candidatus Lambdaproteobacteria bacterium RIFOXYD2_FULL_50_16 TaxID=1817772 RepID=A0A1F6GB18_9PROT|nr:MAG: antitoxin [Candidatus Lambdaproteobacteria bacterium RIFOXYD2_FULL_50_16]
MTHLTLIEASQSLERLVQLVTEAHEPALLTGKEGNAVLISEEDWRSIQETLHLHTIPGMVQSIKEGMKTPLEDCDSELDW